MRKAKQLERAQRQQLQVLEGRAARGPQILAKLWNAQPIDAERAQPLVDATRAALRSLLAGNASDKEFSRVGVDINIGYYLAKKARSGSELVDDLFARAGQALTEAMRMKEEHGRYGLGPQNLREALCEAIDLWEEILRESSMLQLHEAERAVLQAHARQAQAA